MFGHAATVAGHSSDGQVGCQQIEGLLHHAVSYRTVQYL